MRFAFELFGRMPPQVRVRFVMDDEGDVWGAYVSATPAAGGRMEPSGERCVVFAAADGCRLRLDAPADLWSLDGLAPAELDGLFAKAVSWEC